MDNGTENAKHEDISKSLGTKCYFVHPYHSWERGTNENTNSFTRWHLLEGIYFSKLSENKLCILNQL